jgi:hypothetical protein
MQSHPGEWYVNNIEEDIPSRMHMQLSYMQRNFEQSILQQMYSEGDKNIPRLFRAHNSHTCISYVILRLI